MAEDGNVSVELLNNERAASDMLRSQNDTLRQWRTAVTACCRVASGFESLHWGGDKDGWGFISYFIGHLNTRALTAESSLKAKEEECERLKKDFELARTASHLFEDAANVWAKRADAAESSLSRMKEALETSIELLCDDALNEKDRLENARFYISNFFLTFNSPNVELQSNQSDATAAPETECSHPSKIVDELRERTALRYMGDCKCGKCQLVPKELINRTIVALTRPALMPEEAK